MDGAADKLDAGMALPVALAIGLAIGALPLLIAYWPRIVALIAERRDGPGKVPPEITPFVTGVVSGLSMTELLACGFLWVIARTPHGRAAAEQADVAGAEGYLRESLSPPGAVDDAGEVAHTTLEGTNPSEFDVFPVMAGLRESAQKDARNFGLLRNSGLISRLFLVLAAGELGLGLVLNSFSAMEVLVIGAIATAWAAVHVDPRSFSGAKLSGGLRRLRASLRKTALTAKSMDSAALRELVPAAANAAETEVWAVAVGCRTAASERAVSRLGSLAHAEAGRPRKIRYTQAIVVAGEQIANWFRNRLRALRGRGHPEPSGSSPILW
jgi:hypothetical protein